VQHWRHVVKDKGIYIANAAWSYDNPIDRLEMKECVTFSTEKGIKLSFEK